MGKSSLCVVIAKTYISCSFQRLFYGYGQSKPGLLPISQSYHSSSYPYLAPITEDVEDDENIKDYREEHFKTSYY